MEDYYVTIETEEGHVGYDVDGDGVPDMYGIVDRSTNEVKELVEPEVYQRKYSSHSLIDNTGEGDDEAMAQPLIDNAETEDLENGFTSQSSHGTTKDNTEVRKKHDQLKTLSLETVQTLDFAKSRLEQLYKNLEQSVNTTIESTSTFRLNEVKSNQYLNGHLSSLSTSKEKTEYLVQYLTERNRGLSKVLEGMRLAKIELSKRVEESRADSAQILESKLQTCASTARRIRGMRDILRHDSRVVAPFVLNLSSLRQTLRDLTRSVLDAKSESRFCKDVHLDLQDRVCVSAQTLCDLKLKLRDQNDTMIGILSSLPQHQDVKNSSEKQLLQHLKCRERHLFNTLKLEADQVTSMRKNQKSKQQQFRRDSLSEIVTSLSTISKRFVTMDDVQEKLKSHRDAISQQFQDEIQQTIQDCERSLVESRQKHHEELTRKLAQSKESYLHLTSDSLERAKVSREQHVRLARELSTKLEMIQADLHRIQVTREMLTNNRIDSARKHERLASLKRAFRMYTLPKFHSLSLPNLPCLYSLHHTGTMWWERKYDRERYAIFLQRVTVASSSTNPELLKMARDYKFTLERTKPIRASLRKNIPLLTRALERMSLIIQFLREPKLFTSQKCREAAGLVEFVFNPNQEPLKLHETHNTLRDLVFTRFRNTCDELTRYRDVVNTDYKAYQALSMKCELLREDLRTQDGRSLKSLMERSSDVLVSTNSNNILKDWYDATKKLLPRTKDLRSTYLESELVKFLSTLKNIEKDERLAFQDFRDLLGFDPIPTQSSDDQSRHLIRVKFQIERAWTRAQSSLREAHSVMSSCVESWTRWKAFSGATSSLKYDGHDVISSHLEAERMLQTQLKLFPQWFARVSVLLKATTAPGKPSTPDVLHGENSLLIWKHVRYQYDKDNDDEIVIRTDDPIQDRLDELRKEHDIARELVWSKCNDKSPQDLLKLLRLRRTWEACVSDDGDVYYANAETGESAWYVICVCVCVLHFQNI